MEDLGGCPVVAALSTEGVSWLERILLSADVELRVGIEEVNAYVARVLGPALAYACVAAACATARHVGAAVADAADSAGPRAGVVDVVRGGAAHQRQRRAAAHRQLGTAVGRRRRGRRSP